MRKGYLLLLENAILMDCCPRRKKELEKTYQVTVVKYTENSVVSLPHCLLPCLMK